jgi:magnesium transporter
MEVDRFKWSNDQLISWRYVQPLSLEDAGETDAVSLSITRQQIKELPGEDLADAIETPSGEVQHAVFSVLDSEKAAEVLLEAEPRAQRQLIANVRQERARTILSEMSIPQLADLFSVLPHDQMIKMMDLLPKDQAEKIRTIIADLESSADALMSSDFVATKKTTSVAEVLTEIRSSHREPHSFSYLYVVDDEKTLLGVVDIREIILAADTVLLGDLMRSPVVSAQSDDRREDLAELFARYQFHMIPILTSTQNLFVQVNFDVSPLRLGPTDRRRSNTTRSLGASRVLFSLQCPGATVFARTGWACSGVWYGQPAGQVGQMGASMVLSSVIGLIRKEKYPCL